MSESVDAVVTETVPITRPVIDAAEIDAVSAVLRTGMLVQGPVVAAFEESVAAAAGTRHAIATSNCTVALEIALRAMGIGPGDDVAVTAYSWVATSNAIEIVGANPVFVDIDPATFNIDSSALATLLAGRRISAVLPVHTFGNLAGITEVLEVSARYGVPVLEDAACAIGAKHERGLAGGLGRAGCYSFHPRKVVTTGEGGAITTDDDAIAEFARTYRNHGLSGGQFVAVGSNLRMTEMQAAMGLAQMAKLSWIVSERTRLAEQYDPQLESLGMIPQRRAIGSVVQSYVALVPASHSAQDVVAGLRERGVEATVGTIAIPFTPYHAGRFALARRDLPAVAEVERRAVTLPLFPGMSEAQQQRVVDTLAQVLR